MYEFGYDGRCSKICPFTTLLKFKTFYRMRFFCDQFSCHVKSVIFSSRDRHFHVSGVYISFLHDEKRFFSKNEKYHIYSQLLSKLFLLACYNVGCFGGAEGAQNKAFVNPHQPTEHICDMYGDQISYINPHQPTVHICDMYGDQIPYINPHQPTIAYVITRLLSGGRHRILRYKSSQRK